MSESKSKKTVKQESKTLAGAEEVKSKSIFNLGSSDEITYGKKPLQWSLIGVGLIALGMILMSGGWMPSPEIWDESIIYSFRRMVIAPICIVAGLLLQVYAIFKV